MATIPTVHLNGTSYNNLFDGYAAALSAIDHAIDALARAESNGRDFYPQGPEAFRQHRQERQEAFDHLRAAHKHAEEILAGICEQR
jgi:hypothetical protein